MGPLAGGAVLVLLALVAGLLVERTGGRPGPVAVGPSAVPSAVPSPSPSPTPGCSTAIGAFVPTSVTIPAVAQQVPVIALYRDARGIPGVPPISSAGKSELAFDLGSGIRPGDPSGNALLNAHTFPDGSALGNRLLAKLEPGDPIFVDGPLGKICYQVTDRVEVPVTDKGIRYYATSGQPQIAIIVCSGKRVGPGRWTKRTMWYASPVA